MREPFRRVVSNAMVLHATNIDTDQIIPARFLTTTSADGLGKHAFHDWRRLDDGSHDPDCALNHERAEGAAVLVAGDNFGCGSSREHAPWALLDLGFRVVISTKIADIFRQNALKNGLLAIQIHEDAHATLIESAWAEVEVDLEEQHVVLPNGERASFEIDAFAKHCLLAGVDELGHLCSHEDAITSYETGTTWLTRCIPSQCLPVTASARRSSEPRSKSAVLWPRRPASPSNLAKV